MAVLILYPEDLANEHDGKRIEEVKMAHFQQFPYMLASGSLFRMVIYYNGPRFKILQVRRDLHHNSRSLEGRIFSTENPTIRPMFPTPLDTVLCHELRPVDFSRER